MNTSFFVWDDDLYSVGDGPIDAQHQVLLSILNRLYELIHQNGEATRKVDTADLLHELTQYIVDHFSYEEQRMQESSYPLDRLERHRAEHGAIVAKVQGFEARLYEDDPSTLNDMLPYLYGDWLIQHICGTDMDYREYLHPPQAVLS